jgi:hypothetical protein
MHWISQICKIPNCYMCTLNLNWLHTCTKTLLCQLWVFINERVRKFIALIFIYYVFIDVLVATPQNLIFLRWTPLSHHYFFWWPPAKTTSPPILIKNERSLIFQDFSDFFGNWKFLVIFLVISLKFSNILVKLNEIQPNTPWHSLLLKNSMTEQLQVHAFKAVHIPIQPFRTLWPVSIDVVKALYAIKYCVVIGLQLE